MQSLDDDMDDLFRRAGEDYPLNTDNADWNKVLHGLHHSDEDLPNQKKSWKDYRFLLLLLLLPIGFICGRNSSKNNEDILAKSGTETPINKTSAEQLNQTGTSPAEKQGLDSEPNDLVQEKESDVGENSADGKTSSGTQIQNSLKDKKREETIAEEIIEKSANRIPGIRSRLNIKAVPFLEKTQVDKQKTQEISTSVLPTKDLANAPSSALSNTTDEENKLKNSQSSTQKALEDKDTIAAKDTASLLKTTEVTETKKGASDKLPETTKTSKAKAPPFKRKLFYSLVVGPDLSSEKFYKLTKAGYSIGATLGYQFSKKFTVEAGILWDRKNYYTTGEYFDTSKLQLPPWSRITQAQGYCDMIEVPVNIKYNFVTKGKYSWFLSAGLSSYFMQKEDYDITYKRYNQPYVKDYQYNNASKNLFSILNISAGYQTTLGKFTSISIAPYIKVPLAGVGVGKLPINSTGIYMSISRSIH
jgi:hypothetical protein